MNKVLINGNMLEELNKLEENSVDAIITDPPYELNFMNKGWDNAGISFQKSTWEKCLRVLKPGGYLLAFGGSRTFHRIACAIEDAGFEIRDIVMWIYGSGFPKSMNVGIAIDKRLGVESGFGGIKLGHEDFVGRDTTGHMDYSTADGGFHRPWMEDEEKREEYHYEKIPMSDVGKSFKGYGTSLKPSYEPVIMARKPLMGTVADNSIEWGVGGINIDECRIPYEDTANPATNPLYRIQNGYKIGYGVDLDASAYALKKESGEMNINLYGRFPANVVLTYDDSDYDEVCGNFPSSVGSKSQNVYTTSSKYGGNSLLSSSTKRFSYQCGYNDEGSASRYFYCAKASKRDRDSGVKIGKNIHPTVKPVSLMQYLVRLVAPKGAVILDPFMGSGSTGKAVAYENNDRNANYSFIGIELQKEYFEIAEQRISFAESDKNCLDETKKKSDSKKNISGANKLF